MDEQQKLQLVTTMIRSDASFTVDLSTLEKMIHEKLPQELERLAPPNFPELYFDLKAEFEKFRDFLLYEPLIGKKIVALGGGFSSGKSTFLNTLLQTKVLPAKIDPSTSVPTYIVQNTDEKLEGINVFQTKMALQVADLQHIAHGFGRTESEAGALITEEIKLGHILKNLFLQLPTQPFEHIAFLDTPGYSKADTKTYSAKTDEKIARAQLSTADYILWFVEAPVGTITEQDIAFLKTLPAEIPLCVIVNKADKRIDEDVVAIVAEIKRTLDLQGIRYTDVLTFSRFKKKPYDRATIFAQLDLWNNETTEETFAYHFKKLFAGCRTYYEEQMTEENRRLNRLNKALTLADEEIQEYLTAIVFESKKRLQALKDIEERVKQLQDDFFTELKTIADSVGIAMPEPADIDLLQDKIQNPLKVLQSLKEQLQLKPTFDARVTLQSAFRNIVPIFFEQQGQGRYKKVLQQALAEQFQVEEKAVHIHASLQRRIKMKEMALAILGGKQ